MVWTWCEWDIEVLFRRTLSVFSPNLNFVSDIAVFVLKRDAKLQPTNQPNLNVLVAVSKGIWAVELWSDKLFKDLTQVDLYIMDLKCLCSL